MSNEQENGRRVGIVGLGNMGTGMARNLMAKGFTVQGHARRPEVIEQFVASGGVAVPDVARVAQGARAVFLMVMDEAQADDVMAGGLAEALAPGSALIVTATLGDRAVQRLAARLAARSVDLIDCPVSGGKAGADGGTLTLMAAGAPDVIARHEEVLRAVGSTLIHVGTEPGAGQAVKTCLQALIGVSFEGLFEAMALGARAGVDPQTLADVINASFVGSRLTRAATEHIVARRFKHTGSHIATMCKDIGLARDMARDVDLPMPAADAAKSMFDAAWREMPDGDNWCIVAVLERMRSSAPGGTAP
jgi:putative dehydrogenase